MTDELIFLGTAGGRMSVAKQLRASGDAIILTHRHLDHSGDVNAMIACTGYFPELEAAFTGDVLILNVVFYPRRSDAHLCLEDCERLIAAIRPRLAILPHFGMTMVRLFGV